MTKKERIAELELHHANHARRIFILEQQITTLLGAAAQQKETPLKPYKEIQADWYARHGDMLKCPPEKSAAGPVPYAHPSLVGLNPKD